MTRSRACFVASLTSMAASILLVAAPASAQEDASKGTAPASASAPASAPASASASAPTTASPSETPDDAKPPTPRFGDAGQFALSLNEEFSVNITDLIGANQLQASYFVAPHVSLGLMLGAQWASSSLVGGASSSEFALRVGPRIGYDFAISDHVSFWPQIGIDYRRLDETPTNTPPGLTGQGTTLNAVGFTALAPILIHPTKGFFIGAGPTFYTELVNNASTGNITNDNNKVTAVGLMATIGGAI